MFCSWVYHRFVATLVVFFYCDEITVVVYNSMFETNLCGNCITKLEEKFFFSMDVPPRSEKKAATTTTTTTDVFLLKMGLILDVA